MREKYADRGRPSVDPVVFFKLQLIMVFEGIRSERQLIEQASLNLAHRWYLGYSLDEPLPDHSTLTKIRRRPGLSVFRQFFDQIVELCQDAGLIWGKEVIFDATKVRANASLDSVVPRLNEVIDGHLVELFAGDDDPPSQDAEPDDGTPPLLHPETVTSGDAVGDPTPKRWDLLEECRLDPTRPAARGYTRLSDERISRTDPDAALMRARTDHPRQLGYHTHYVVDGGKARIILHVLVTPADVMENQPMLDELRRIMFRWKLHPKRVIADTTYGTVENIVALEDDGIRACVPLPDFDERTPHFGASKFNYDPETDSYHCPNGAGLVRKHAKYTEGVIVYQADAASCNACPLKEQCTESANGRMVHRSLVERDTVPL